MNMKRKAIHNQVIVITGASGGIGLATARMAIARGARVVLSSSDANALKRLSDDFNREQAKDRPLAAWVTADITDANDVQTIADTAVRVFGGFDTWVNAATLSVPGHLREVTLSEKRRLFDVNFWGVVHGCRVAVPHLSKQGGAIINIGGGASDDALPGQGIYAASKQAVNTYTDTLRMECRMEGLPISISVVKPVVLDTPHTEPKHDRIHEPLTQGPSPHLAEIVAEAILACAEAPRRELFVGGSPKAFTLMEQFAPRPNAFASSSLRPAQAASYALALMGLTGLILKMWQRPTLDFEPPTKRESRRFEGVNEARARF